MQGRYLCVRCNRHACAVMICLRDELKQLSLADSCLWELCESVQVLVRVIACHHTHKHLNTRGNVCLGLMHAPGCTDGRVLVVILLIVVQSSSMKIHAATALCCLSTMSILVTYADSMISIVVCDACLL